VVVKVKITSKTWFPFLPDSYTKSVFLLKDETKIRRVEEAFEIPEENLEPVYRMITPDHLHDWVKIRDWADFANWLVKHHFFTIEQLKEVLPEIFLVAESGLSPLTMAKRFIKRLPVSTKGVLYIYSTPNRLPWDERKFIQIEGQRVAKSKVIPLLRLYDYTWNSKEYMLIALPLDLPVAKKLAARLV
jgi:hypothetical protein